MSFTKLKRKPTKKPGRRFEELIAWIQESVHTDAIIKANERIKDIDTGKPRQVDITIRLSDGPTTFLGIVEVRDRNRPIGVRYVEEISGKLRSVKADAAFLVSRSGFTKTAIVKADQLGIRILNYEEARNENWSGWLQCRTFGIMLLRYDNPVVTPFEYGTDRRFNPSIKVIEILKNDPNAKIFSDEHGNQTISLPDLVNKIINIFDKNILHDNIPHDGTRVKKQLLYQGQFEPSLWVESETDINIQIGKVLIEAEFYIENKEFPLKLMRYRIPDSDQSIAELATTEIEILGKKYIIEMLAPRAGDNIPAGTTVSFRSTKIENGS